MSHIVSEHSLLDRLFDLDYRQLVLAELHNHHISLDAPPKLAAYFLRRIELFLDGATESIQTHNLIDLEMIEYDFGYLGFFNPSLELLRSSISSRL